MASPVYSSRFISAPGLSTTRSYTVPAGYIAIIRDLDAYGNITGFADLYLHGASGETLYWFHWSALQQEAVLWRGRQVIYAGESFDVTVSTGGIDAVDVAVSGYLLTQT